MNLCTSQSLAGSSGLQNTLHGFPSLGRVSSPKTLGLVTAVALVVLASIASLVGGTICAVWIGGVLGGVIGFSIALVSALVLIFSSQTFYCLIREIKCGGVSEPMRAPSPDFVSQSSEMVETKLNVPSMFEV